MRAQRVLKQKIGNFIVAGCRILAIGDKDGHGFLKKLVLDTMEMLKSGLYVSAW